MKKELKRALITFLGVLFLIFGVIGLVLPIINGLLLIILGLLILSIEFTLIDEKLAAWALKYPLAQKIHAKLRTFIRKVFGEEDKDIR